jgi:hypothetical protein
VTVHQVCPIHVRIGTGGGPKLVSAKREPRAAKWRPIVSAYAPWLRQPRLLAPNVCCLAPSPQRCGVLISFAQRYRTSIAQQDNYSRLRLTTPFPTWDSRGSSDRLAPRPNSSVTWPPAGFRVEWRHRPCLLRPVVRVLQTRCRYHVMATSCRPQRSSSMAEHFANTIGQTWG